jgi:hypothetical protein
MTSSFKGIGKLYKFKWMGSPTPAIPTGDPLPGAMKSSDVTTPTLVTRNSPIYWD